ncbi:response regulator receiver domain-containing protein [Thermoflavifilum aggregans]|uniref:Response regulator receiver domain-containing protein n=1 Tax=Thermoflavifilum aggregans TaxID=454188 RepID=A0A2M9CUY2_9BACT|nr:response regulator [Thermoflavifilum aggregans]PJJ75731.1 response regulator receiver domain-containing protein [Thermoflavifilum aggregans]
MAQYPLKRIFLIDDDPIHQQIAVLMLQKAEVVEEVTGFQEAQAALDYIRAHAAEPEALPEVILLDLNMPVMDGWAFLDAFEQMRDGLLASVRIFIYTSSINYHDRLRAHQYPSVTGYLVKPLSKEDIQRIANIAHS